MPMIGVLLKRQRDRHGWTQQEVVERAGLDRSSSYLSSIETGRTSPTIAELDALSRLFGTTSVDLLREATGITPDWEFEPNTDLASLVNTYQALDESGKESARAYVEFLLDRQHRKAAN